MRRFQVNAKAVAKTATIPPNSPNASHHQRGRREIASGFSNRDGRRSGERNVTRPVSRVAIAGAPTCAGVGSFATMAVFPSVGAARFTPAADFAASVEEVTTDL